MHIPIPKFPISSYYRKLLFQFFLEMLLLFSTTAFISRIQRIVTRLIERTAGFNLQRLLENFNGIIILYIYIYFVQVSQPRREELQNLVFFPFHFKQCILGLALNSLIKNRRSTAQVKVDRHNLFLFNRCPIRTKTKKNNS